MNRRPRPGHRTASLAAAAHHVGHARLAPQYAARHRERLDAPDPSGGLKVLDTVRGTVSRTLTSLHWPPLKYQTDRVASENEVTIGDGILVLQIHNFAALDVMPGFRAELIDGEIIVSPPPDGQHETIVVAVDDWVREVHGLRLHRNLTLISPEGEYVLDGIAAPRGAFAGREWHSKPDGVASDGPGGDVRPSS